MLMTPPCMRAVALIKEVEVMIAYPAFSTIKTPPYTALLKSIVPLVMLNSQSAHFSTAPKTD
jgi:hypothetical protein